MVKSKYETMAIPDLRARDNGMIVGVAFIAVIPEFVLKKLSYIFSSDADRNLCVIL